MATIKFFIKGDKEESTIHVRFSNGRKFDFKRSTPYRIKTKHWNQSKEMVRNITDANNKDEINSDLTGLKSLIDKQYLEDYKKGIFITGDWLQLTIDKFYSQLKDSDLNLLTEYGKYFVSNLSHKKNSAKGGELGVSKRTVEKYENVLNKIQAFEKHRRSKLLVCDINTRFETEFIKYLAEVDKLSDNTIGRLLTFVKTICKDAKMNGIKTHPQLDLVKGFKKDAVFIYLNEFEIDKIYNHDFSKIPYLDNARDWLIIGLYTGQRVSDFMNFNSSIVKNGFLEFAQIKTGNKTLVPVHPRVEAIINKYNGEFPRRISEQNFNVYIKTVCEKVGLTQEVEGSKINKETKRKEFGNFPKHQLVTSHICRRSFATNHYGKLPTPVIMSITNHSTEKMFLKYIGKTQKDHAEQLKEYWDKIEDKDIKHIFSKSA